MRGGKGDESDGWVTLFSDDCVLSGRERRIDGISLGVR